MPVLGVGGPEAGERLARCPLRDACFENVEHFDGRPRLRGWRQLEDVEAVILARGRLDPLALVPGKIGQRHRPPERVRLGDDRSRDLALVEHVGTLCLQ